MKKNIGNYTAAVIGLLLLFTGLYFVKITTEPQGIMKALPYVLIGLGCGIFGHGTGEVISNRAIKNHPDIEKQMKINKEDERNIAVRNRAKAKAYNAMIYVFGALMPAFALMGVDMAAVLLLVFAYLFIIGCGIYYHSKFEKEM